MSSWPDPFETREGADPGLAADLPWDGPGGYQKQPEIRDHMMMPEKDPISGIPNRNDSTVTVTSLGDLNPKTPGEGVTLMFYFVTSWVLFLQGISSMSSLAVSYFYKNTLQVEPALLSTITSLTALPWTIKPLYGFLSDGWPILGYRRKPYLIISGILGSVSWFCMAVLVNDVWFGFVCMFIASMGMAVSNVIAEGMVVEKSRGQTQEFASHLQAFVHGAQAIGGIIAAYFGGFLLQYLADRHMFMLCAVFPLTIIVVALISPEVRFDGDLTAIRSDMAGKLKELWEAFQHPQIYKPVAFVFMLNATPATGATWFYFYTNVLHFSSTFLGTINVVGAICSLGGVLIFGNFLANTPFRPILIWSTIISTVFGLSQLALVFGWNREWGIPDAAFCIGESAILSILGWINTMPILVLAARLCPVGMEATMYALIMSVNNLGGVIGTQFGALITWGLGVTDSNLDNFWILVLICNLSTVLPLVFIGWIPPDGEDYGAEITAESERSQQKQKA
uniref:Major facilitator superfamily (MFS) profile domain-containing protein n=1 Tax=Hanusia phi TaxID=3032 RepID=A0A7S0EYR4_9CRYP|mmetsp:Transcript_34517/g.77836  ORF Transcript_34517/g.77836 Transcript_34517/m.77836 type:complete len:508 (+) Transcript_34517:35-1558(+)